MHRRARRRSYLLSSTSAAVLLALVPAPGGALADDAGNGELKLWLDLTGQYSMNSGGRTVYGAPFSNFFGPVLNPTVGVRVPNGYDGKVGLTVLDDDWYFNLAFDYGRTGNSYGDFSYGFVTPTIFKGSNFHSATGSVVHYEQHEMLDFTVGQDVGLGMVGLDGTSIVSAGVRWANFIGTTLGDFSYSSKYYSTAFSRRLRRTFNGVGPMLAWKASTPLEGTDFSLNWGVNGAILFGKQSVHGTNPLPSYPYDLPARSRNATVPQVGGSLSIGYHLADTPVALSAGYGVNASWHVFYQGFLASPSQRSVDRVTHGPFVNLSIEMQ